MRNANNTSPRVVVIGGGTGLSTMLRGLKRYTDDLTAIVCVTDDGGGSGVLRTELGMPPPGDIRNCLEALANTEPTMQELLAYRFTEGRLKGQSFGNLFLAALNGVSSSFDEAVSRMSEVLAITGRVLPVTNESGKLIAEFEDGTQVVGESRIASHKSQANCRISRVFLDPQNPPALPESIKAIERAQLLVLGPGSLYTSIIPNLLTDGISDAIARSNAVRVYVLNIMTQIGETEHYTASDHIRVLFEHSSNRLFDYCLANSAPIPNEVIERYIGEGAEPTWIDYEEINKLGVELFEAPVADKGGKLARHDPAALATELFSLYRERAKTQIY